MNLDAHQQALCDVREGNIVAAAAAGSGKTRVTVERAAALVRDGVSPERILSLAYNTTAGAELKKRLAILLGESVGGRVDAGTFHSWAYGVLRKRGSMTGWTVFSDDQNPSQVTPLALASQVLKRISNMPKLYTDAAIYDSVTGYALESMVTLHPDNKGRDINIIESLIPADWERDEWAKKIGEGEAFYAFAQAWLAEKKQRKLIQFADMLWFVGNMIKTDKVPQLLSAYDHVMVDEAQDSNIIRWYIADYLASQSASYVMTGDMRQSIYSGFGARPALFEAPLIGVGRTINKKVAPVRATLMTLPTNYRSGASIVAVGNNISNGQTWNLGGEVLARPNAPEGSINREVINAGIDEALAVTQEIQARLANGESLVDVHGHPRFCILSRTHEGLGIIEGPLRTAKIPFRRSGGSVYTSKGVTILHAYLAAGSKGEWNHCKAIYNVPTRYIRSRDLDDVSKMQPKAAEAYLRDMAQTVAHLGELVDALDDIKHAPTWADRISLAANHLGDSLDPIDESDAVSVSKHAAVDGAIAAVESCADLNDLETRILDARKKKTKAERDEELSRPAVILSTCHAIKGQEHDVVFVTGVNPGTFPSMRGDADEERRLFYVACTRAKTELKVYSASSGNEFSQLAKITLATPPMVRRGDSLVPVAMKPTYMQPEIDVPGAYEAHAADFEMRELYARDLNNDDPEPTHVIADAATWEEAEREAASIGRATKTAAGTRSVPVTDAEFAELLTPLNFERASADVESRAHQLVFVGSTPLGALNVYTTIPTQASTARDVGEDSIRVTYINGNTPVLPKLKHIARTKNWRFNLLKLIHQMMDLAATLPACSRCGGRTAIRESRNGTFVGCQGYPVCAGTSQLTPEQVNLIGE